MSNYTKATNFATKDALTTGNPLKTLSGTELDDEFNAIQVANNTKANASNAALTGTPVAPTAATATDTTQIATTAFVQANDALQLNLSGGAMTGAITTNSTFDGVDIATRDAVLTSTTTTANAALPKAGGALTGAVTTNSTFDGRDVAADGVTADAALPKAGGTMTGDTSHGDNVKSKYGTGNDLEIYHDGTDSRIDEVGGNRLILRSSDDIRMDKYTGENMGVFNADGSVDLYYDAVKKLATTATGIDVTGTVTADGLVVNGGTDNIVATFESTDSDALIEIKDNGTSDTILFGASGDDFLFRCDAGAFTYKVNNNATTAMTIDNSGNVGIGAAPVAGDFEVHCASGGELRVDNYGSSGVLIKQLNAGSGTSGSMLMQAGSNIILATNDTNEAMRIDSSGNMLVGKTASATNTAGIEASAGGGLWVTRSGYPTANFNRLSSDGDIVQFRKDGTTVGSIGSRSSGTALQIYTSSTGIDFGGDGLLPMVGSTITDNSRDIGSGSYRFKDAYLSGGVYLGGTGAANKLDDYEEGTWTPVLNSFTITGTVTTTGTYTKIGNLVFVKCAISAASGTLAGTGGTAYISGLPITDAYVAGTWALNNATQSGVTMVGNSTISLVNSMTTHSTYVQVTATYRV